MPSLGSLLRKSPRSSDARKLQHNGDVTTTPTQGEGIDKSNGAHLGPATIAPAPSPAINSQGVTSAGTSFFSTSPSNNTSTNTSTTGVSAVAPSSPRERRFSKRDILHDFLSRSIRGTSSRSGSTSDSSTASASTLTPQRGNSESSSPAKLVKQRSTAVSLIISIDSMIEFDETPSSSTSSPRAPYFMRACRYMQAWLPQTAAYRLSWDRFGAAFTSVISHCPCASGPSRDQLGFASAHLRTSYEKQLTT